MRGMITLLLVLMATVAMADEARIKELVTEYDKNTKTITEYARASEALKARQSEIVGAVKELDRIAQDEKKAETTT